MYQKSRIESLSFITSLGCNLQCDYCVIHKAKMRDAKRAATIQQKIIESLKDGSFFTNAKDSLISYGGNPNDIKYIALWGQEQTLVLELIEQNLPLILHQYPNLETLFFSTNGVTGAEKIVSFAQTIDKHAKGAIRLSIQWSYDGEYGSKEVRHDTEINSLKTMRKTIELLNPLQFHALSIDFVMHGVISQSLIEHLNGDMDAIKEFWDNNRKVGREIHELSVNRHLFIQPNIQFGPEVPYKSTTEEGIEFYDFYLKSAIVEGLPFLAEIKSVTGWVQLFQFNPDFKDKIQDIHQVVEYYGRAFHNLDISYHSQNLSTSLYCGVGVGDLKIMYDGSLVNCQNLGFENTIEQAKTDPDAISRDMKVAWIEKGMSINPLFATEEELDKYKYIGSLTKNSSFYFAWQTTFNKMVIMAKCHQISPAYNENPDLMLRHSFILTFMSHCMYNNGIYTGSIFSKDTGLIRRYCNGFLEKEEAELNRQLLYKDFDGLLFERGPKFK